MGSPGNPIRCILNCPCRGGTMRCYFSPLAVTLALLIACSSQAAEKPRAAQSNQNQPKKVWTNDDMDELSARGLISIVGQEAPGPSTQKPAGPAESGPAFPVYESRLDDPEWYADQAASLQAELDKRRADLQQHQEAIAIAKDRITQPGLPLDKPIDVTPEARLADLDVYVEETQAQ